MGFEKGKSGNPGGRPRKSEEQIRFERRCREYADLFGFDRLKKWAESEDPKVSMPALFEIENRGFGKSVETSVIDAYVAPQTGVGADEIAGEIASLVPGAAAESVRVDIENPLEPGK